MENRKNVDLIFFNLSRSSLSFMSSALDSGILNCRGLATIVMRLSISALESSPALQIQVRR
ncbi:hypothetical protein Hanom_Chr00s000002g01600161 [Helianthus anomalus]